MEISIEHLNKNYGKQNVLKDISLHIPIGMYGMLGENGAGKTTLMRILATLSEPTTGMVEINGIDIKRKKEKRIYIITTIITISLFIICAFIVYITPAGYYTYDNGPFGL